MSELASFDLCVGDQVAIDGDDWTLLGHEFIVVDIEPVAGSTQCIVSDQQDRRVVSRSDLRRMS